MNKKISILLTAVVAGLLAACTPRVNQQLVAEPDPVALRLAAAADKASSALQTLAAIEQTRNPGEAVQMPPTAPRELRRIVSIDWTGPIEPIAQMMADRAGYRLQVNGDKPPAPIVVSVMAREKSVIEVLRDIGLKAGQRADVAIDPTHHLVELNYAPVSGG
ncbi:MAG: DotD/TraH family lipoprotein [Alphaproteobacteria bacterium]|nr:DotD/TraH family lipoprotein [Alphaproteobacteria bacterium]